MKESIDKLRDLIEDGKRLQDKFPDCKIIQTLVELEKDLDAYLRQEIIK